MEQFPMDQAVLNLSLKNPLDLESGQLTEEDLVL